MTPRITIKGQKMQQDIGRYLAASKRELSEAINYKAYFIIQRAMRHTKKADKKEIRAFIRGPEGQEMIGKMFGLRRFKKNPPATRAEATKQIISARVRSVAYLAAGWAKALAVFGREAKASRRLKGVSARGGLKSHSKAKPARPGTNPSATWANPAGYKNRVKKPGQKYTQDEAMRKFGEPIYQAAFRAEVRSMAKYVERKMAKATKRYGGGR